MHATQVPTRHHQRKNDTPSHNQRRHAWVDTIKQPRSCRRINLGQGVSSARGAQERRLPSRHSLWGEAVTAAAERRGPGARPGGARRPLKRTQPPTPQTRSPLAPSQAAPGARAPQSWQVKRLKAISEAGPRPSHPSTNREGRPPELSPPGPSGRRGPARTGKGVRGVRPSPQPPQRQEPRARSALTQHWHQPIPTAPLPREQPVQNNARPYWLRAPRPPARYWETDSPASPPQAVIGWLAHRCPVGTAPSQSRRPRPPPSPAPGVLRGAVASCSLPGPAAWGGLWPWGVSRGGGTGCSRQVTFNTARYPRPPQRIEEVICGTEWYMGCFLAASACFQYILFQGMK